MKRGEVYYLRGDRSYGHEMATGRPVVVVSSDDALRNSYTATVVFMTTAPKQWGTIVELNSTPRRSYVVCNQMATVDKERLADADKMCEVTAREMLEIEAGLLKVLGLNNDDVVCDNTDVIRLEFEKDFYKRECDKWRDGMFSLLSEKLDRKESEPVVIKEEKPVVVEKPVMQMTKEDLKPEMSDEEIMKVLEDAGMKVSKKKTNSVGNPESYRGRAKLAKDAKAVNINTATKEELEAIGINDQTARNIVNYRKKNGRYHGVEDLLLVPRFGKGCMAVFGPMLRV